MEHVLQHEKHAESLQPARHAAPSPAQPLGLQLQQQAGNQAVQELLRTGVIRAKLAISRPDDADEQEAEAVAQRVMRSPAGSAPTAPTACSCGENGENMCDECRQKKAAISRAADSPAAASPSSRAAHQVLRAIHGSSGHALDADARSFFEPRFGRDLSGVRIHTDAAAASSARSINALAFTTGSDIFFASGQYASHTDSGRHLLAHELTHTLQKQPDPPGADLDFVAVREQSAALKINRQNDPLDAGTPNPTSNSDDTDLDAGAAAQHAPQHFDFEGMPFTADMDEERSHLEGYLEDHGLEALQGIGPRFEAELQRLRYVNSPDYLSDVSGVPDWVETNHRHLDQMQLAAPVFRSCLAGVIRESNQFLSAADAQAHAVLEEMLTSSTDRITSERDRYGLANHPTSRTVQRHVGGGDFNDVTIVTPHYSMATNNATRGMAAAASRLAAKVRSVRSLMDARNSQMPIAGATVPTEATMAAYTAADDRVKAAVGEYNVMRFTAEADYPILAAYTPLDTTGTYYVDQTISKLDAAAHGSSNQLAGTLYDETQEKLDNIARVRQAVADGDLNVWKLPSVVSLTGQRVNMLPLLMQARLINDKVHAAESEGEILNIALGVLAIALGALAAIPTGGGSLAAGVAVAAGLGSAALGTYFALEHIQQYAIEAAANGTDFDKARAISQVEPSLFWLAVDIIGALGGAAADIHAALGTFRTLSASLREASELRQLARQGQRAAEADAAVNRLRQEGENIRHGLGQKLVDAVGREGTAVEHDAAIAAWEGAITPRSRAFLVDNPEVRAVYRDMDEQLRWLCTHCSDNCLIEGLTRTQTARINNLTRGLSQDELAAIREFLHGHKHDLEAGITELERVTAASPKDPLTAEINRAFGPSGTDASGLYDTSRRLVRGNVGERLATDVLATRGHDVLIAKPSILGTNQGGIDIVTIRNGTVYLIDNKALTRAGNIASVSALTTNFKQNLQAVLTELTTRLADPSITAAERTVLQQAVTQLQAGNYVRAVTNANVFVEGAGTLSGVTSNLNTQGIQFIDVMGTPAPPPVTP